MTLPIDPNSTVRIDAPTGVVVIVEPQSPMLRCISCQQERQQWDVITGVWLSGPYVCTECARANASSQAGDRGGSCRVCGAAALFKNRICPSCERKRATA